MNTNPRHFDVLTVGAGHGGTELAVALSRVDARITVGLVSAEEVAPYNRPALSKAFLKGLASHREIQLHADFFEKSQSATLLLGEQVTHVDASTRTVTTTAGRSYSYGSLVWSAGGAARVLDVPGNDLSGVHSLRDLSDVEAIGRSRRDARRATVIGGGYVGLETASALNELGLEVTVIESQPRLLTRVTGEVMSRFVGQLHESNGVDILYDTTVARIIQGRTGRVESVVTSDGVEIQSDLVVVGVGLEPKCEVLRDAGVTTENGIVVDKYCRTNLENIFAIGDCASFVSSFAQGRRVRLESVQNAREQANAVARTIGGDETPYTSVPWFWTDQFGVKMQTAGLFHSHDEVVVRGNTSDEQFSVVYLVQGQLVAIDAVRRPTDYVQARALLRTSTYLDAARVADPNVSLDEAVVPA